MEKKAYIDILMTNVDTPTTISVAVKKKKKSIFKVRSFVETGAYSAHLSRRLLIEQLSHGQVLIYY